MKRSLLLAVALLAVFAIPARATAAVPCRDRVYNDWYHDGKISSGYPIACYRDALKHVTGDLQVYSSLSDDIRSAMQAAIERQAGKKVPLQVGKGLPATETPVSSVKPTAQGPKSQTAPTQTTTTVAAGPVSSTGGGGGVPLPLLVLGALAILLVAAGLVGAVVRRRSGGGPARPA